MSNQSKECPQNDVSRGTKCPWCDTSCVRGHPTDVPHLHMRVQRALDMFHRNRAEPEQAEGSSATASGVISIHAVLSKTNLNTIAPVGTSGELTLPARPTWTILWEEKSRVREPLSRFTTETH
eukprot:scaffold990_cov393-Prasinococcus_capsulatus_cf.AAC.50